MYRADHYSVLSSGASFTAKMIEFDVILSKIGSLSWYQLYLVSLAYWLAVPAGMHNVASVFYAANVNLR